MTLKLKVMTLSGKAESEVTLHQDVFGLTPRNDILARVVNWQRAGKMAGTHQVKGRSEVKATTAKPFKQKGTGNARQGSKVAPHMRGGGVAHGPQTRSHATKLPKAIRRLGLRHALSLKQSEGKLTILKDAEIKDAKTATLRKQLAGYNLETNTVLMVDKQLSEKFALASRNVKHLDVLPFIGINVYDILRHDHLILTVDALKSLEERLAS